MHTFGRWYSWAVLLTVSFSAATAGLHSASAQSTGPAPNEARLYQASGNEPIVRVTGPSSKFKIVETFAKILEFDAKIKRVDGFDPEVVSFSALGPNRLRVQAMAPGITTAVIEDELGIVRTVDLFVVGDVRHLQAYLEQFFPRASVEAIPVKDSLVLRGWVTEPKQITEIVEVAKVFYPNVINNVEVGGVQQVLLKVKVMEVQRSKIRQLGINLFFVGQNGYFASTPGQLVPLAALTTPFGGPPGLTPSANALPDATLSFGIVNDSSIFNAFVEALKQESLLKILAEPKLVTANGRPANLLAGGEFPILVPQSLGTVSIEWREFGTRLEAVPILIGNGRLRLELQPEVSERDFSNAVTLSGTTVPGLTTRRVNTQVEMKFGQTLVLGGLIATRNTAHTQKVPWLGELPWVGAAFRRERYDETETELVIMVTPELVAPIPAGEVPPGGPGLFTTTPTDHELYIDGMIEVPNYGDQCPDCPNGFPGMIGPATQPQFAPTEAGPMPAPAEIPPAPPAPGARLNQQAPDAAEGTSAGYFGNGTFQKASQQNAMQNSPPPSAPRQTQAPGFGATSDPFADSSFGSGVSGTTQNSSQLPKPSSNRLNGPGLIEPSMGRIAP